MSTAPVAATARRPGAQIVLACLLALAALAIAVDAGVQGVAAVPDVARGVLATLAVVVLCGLAPARLLLAPRLMAHFALFVPLVGCAVAGLALTTLGFAGVPLPFSLATILGLGTVGAVVAHRRLGPIGASADGDRAGGRLLSLGWPVYLATMLVAILLVPMFQAGYTSVPGQNPDGMLGVGVAELLQSTHPLGADNDLPIDTMPLVWRSKYPIYYVLAASSTLSGLEPIKVFAAEAAVLAALTAIAFMLLALYGLRAGPGAGLLVMTVIGFGSLIAHLAGHPYHNQLWGTLALPMILLFGMRWLEERRRGDAALALLFAAVGLSAYPLMVLFPALALTAGAFVLRRGRGLPRPRLGRPRTARSIALAAVLAVFALPAALVVVLGVLEKSTSAAELLFTGKSLGPWRGDLLSYREPGFFVGVPTVWGYLAAVLVLAAGSLGLREAPPAWRAALGAAIAGGLAFALLFRLRDFGEYFHFKVLAFAAPMLLTVAAVWLARRTAARGRGARAAALVGMAFVGAQFIGLGEEVRLTNRQVDAELFELRDASRGLPEDASVRLDVLPDGRQLWAAYMLKEHPLSASSPLTGTTFPYARLGRKADYLLADSRLRLLPWPDAVGPPIFENRAFRVYRMRRDVPGPDISSKQLVDAFSPGFD